MDERVATFRELAERIGRERVVWRFDPLIVTQELTLLERLFMPVKRVIREGFAFSP